MEKNKELFRMSKKIVVLFIMGFLISVVSYGAIQIKTIEELQKIGKDPAYPLNGDYELANDIDASDTINWNEGKGFEPIGFPTQNNPNVRPFTGTFNGKNKVIKNLYINRPDKDYIGLFCKVGDKDSVFVADVYDLVIENSIDYVIKGGNYVGLIAGSSENAKVRFCKVASKVEGQNSVGSLLGENRLDSLSIGNLCYVGTIVKGNSSIGGLIGRNLGSIEKSTSSAIVQGNTNVGGLVGVNDNEGTMKWCVVGKGAAVSGSSNTGGVVGENKGSIIESQNDGSVSGGNNIGGLVGSNTGSITDCFSTGSVRGATSIGGLVGANGGTINRCYSIGQVTGNSSVGGLVGTGSSSSVTSSFWNIETSGVNVSSGGIGKTTQEMYGKEIYVSWDFEFVWKETVFYPKLLLGAEDMFLPGEEVMENTILIWTIDQLTMIGNVNEYPLNGTYKLARDIDAQSTVTMNSGAGFTPIGNRRRPFTGKFYGNDNKIVNLFINASNSFVGLFGFLGEGAYIERVGIENAIVNGISYVGALAGYNKGGRILQCNAYRVAIEGFSNIGALVGGNDGTVDESFALISRVTEPVDTEMGFAYGGLVGFNIGDIRKCYSFSYVDGNANIGGLVGENAFGGNIIRSYTLCNADFNVTGIASVGGLIGNNDGGVEECFVVPCDDVDTTHVSGDKEVGGLIGQNGYRVEKSYSSVIVAGISSVGGLIGFNWYGDVDQCYSLGSVLGDECYIGGLVGYNWVSDITNCYSASFVKGDCIVGGLVGYHRGTDYPNLDPDIDIQSVIDSCYSVGLVQGESTVGGLIGYIEKVDYAVSPVTKSYWDTQTSKQTKSAGGEGKTTTDMKKSNTYIGWTFLDIWGITENISYPYFIWQRDLLLPVPNIVGVDAETAKTNLTKMGLSFIEVKECSNVVSKDRIISQNPEANNEVVIGSTITLVVSSGPCITIPNLIGIDRDDAITALERLGLTVGNISLECSDTVSVNAVKTQNPIAGTEVQEGTLVDLVISSGYCNPVQIPNVINLPEVEAQEQLSNIGLNVNITRQCSNQVELGRVVSQSPDPGSIIGLGGVVNIVISTGLCPVTVPNVIGKSESEARTLIESVGLIVGTVSQQCNNVIQQGLVANQSPSGGTQIQPGSIVNISVSTGPCPVSVPNLVGKTETEARNLIQSASLTVGTVSQECSNTVSQGKVISQMPTGGTQVAQGTSVNIVLSSGPCPVTVPNVVGESETDAKNIIENAGLKVGTVTQQCSNTISQGKIISQTPSVGTQVSLGSSVNIIVSTGPCPVVVPNVVGKTETEARNLIVSAGLTVGNVTQQCNNSISQGKVISQTPLGGAQVASNSSINIVISTGPCPVSVPNVVGKSETEAKTMIESVGLKLGTINRQCDNSLPQNKVISQIPSAETEVAYGSSINITVSTGPCSVTVPNVVGTNETQARNSIKEAGLFMGSINYQCNNSVSQGNVISQTPTAGESVSYGSAVSLVISTGSCPVTVPNVVGKKEAEARSIITGVGLTIGTVSQQCDNSIASGTVISQSPSAGVTVYSTEEKVNIVISTGPCSEGALEGIQEGESTPPEEIFCGCLQPNKQGAKKKQDIFKLLLDLILIGSVVIVMSGVKRT